MLTWILSVWKSNYIFVLNIDIVKVKLHFSLEYLMCRNQITFLNWIFKFVGSLHSASLGEVFLKFKQFCQFSINLILLAYLWYDYQRFIKTKAQQNYLYFTFKHVYHQLNGILPFGSNKSLNEHTPLSFLTILFFTIKY